MNLFIFALKSFSCSFFDSVSFQFFLSICLHHVLLALLSVRFACGGKSPLLLAREIVS